MPWAIATCCAPSGRRIRVDLWLGDRVEWKWSGFRGTLHASVIGFTDKRVTILVDGEGKPRNVQPRFLHVYREDGRHAEPFGEPEA